LARYDGAQSRFHAGINPKRQREDAALPADVSTYWKLLARFRAKHNTVHVKYAGTRKLCWQAWRTPR